jgi:hypothetical protein
MNATANAAACERPSADGAMVTNGANADLGVRGGAGRFRFTMHIRHPQFGEMFHHDGVFAPQGDCP